MTVMIETIDDIIVRGPPIIRKFKGQPINNLRRWMQKQGGFREDEIDDF